MKSIAKLIALVSLLPLAARLPAQVPQMISYQGSLTSSGTNFSGISQFKLALVNGAGSLTYWSNDGSSSGGSQPGSGLAVPVTNGLFTIELGNTALSHMTMAIPPNVFTNPDVRLRLWVSDGSSAFQQLSPDQRLLAAGYAMHSATATMALSVIPGGLTSTGTVVQVNTGAGLTGGPISTSGTISIPNGAVSNALLQHATISLTPGSGLTGGGSVALGGSTTLSIGNGAVSNVLLANPSLTVSAGAGLSGGGNVALGGSTGLAANLNHDSTLLGNGGASSLGLNLTNANTWTATQSFTATINGSISGNASAFTGPLAGDVTGNQGATVITNLSASKIAGLFRWQTIASMVQQALPNVGYLVTNSSQVTITLPATPSVGDTVRISSPGAGGWKLAQNAGQSILAGNFGTLKIGHTWANRGPTANWSCVASSGNGSKFVAAVTAGQIYTTTDSGATWLARDTNRAWTAVASSADGVKLLAAVNGGQIYVSTDSGTTWSPRELSRAWSAVAASADGAKLVAVVNGGQIYTSADSGATWTPHATSSSWASVASSDDGTKLLAGASNGQLFNSTDSGATWTAHGPGGNWYSVASSSDGSRLVAGSRGYQVYTSADAGTNWTPRGSSANWSGVACSADGTRLCAVASGAQIYTSTDSGQTWLVHDTYRSWQAVACSADATMLVAAVSGGQLYVSEPPMISPSTTTTVGPSGYLTGGPCTAIELQYVGNSQFLALSHEGLLFAY